MATTDDLGAGAAGGARRVLVVEDEETLAESMRYHLEREGYHVVSVADGSEAVALVDEDPPDLIVLDLMIPGIGGFDVLRRVRRQHQMPVLIVTARDDEVDRVTGLELGADDYVTKPFSMRELIARVGANLRRIGGVAVFADHILEAAGVRLDPERHEVWVENELVHMRPKEFELLEHLMLRSGRLVTRQTLLNEVWGYPFYGDPKTLDVHIRRLRRKIEANPAKPARITTVRGLGYKFAES